MKLQWDSQASGYKVVGGSAAPEIEQALSKLPYIYRYINGKPAALTDTELKTRIRSAIRPEDLGLSEEDAEYDKVVEKAIEVVLKYRKSKEGYGNIESSFIGYFPGEF